MVRSFLFLLLLLSKTLCAFAQTNQGNVTILDSAKPLKLADTSRKAQLIRPHNPKKATLLSTFVPGLGQFYNKEYWKIPIVYAALSIPTYTYFYNDKYYQITKFAYEAKYKATYNKDYSDTAKIDPLVKNLSLNALRNYRNEFRRDRDYSILWFIIVWGLNVVDATVFGHLKDFNVNDNISMHIEPTAPLLIQNQFQGGLSLSFSYNKRKLRKQNHY